MPTYRQLKAGDIRQLGDEGRLRYEHSSWFAKNTCTYEFIGLWFQCNLIGWEILPADLFNAEFRRRII
jgi:hypothetical protein